MALLDLQGLSAAPEMDDHDNSCHSKCCDDGGSGLSLLIC